MMLNIFANKLFKNIHTNTLLLISASAMLLVSCTTSSGKSIIGRQALEVARESRVDGKGEYKLGPQYEAKLDEMVSNEFFTLQGQKDEIPMEVNRNVLVNINYFLNDGRGFMTRSLERGQKYIPMMKAIFRKKGLPEDLVYLALIESGFRTEAVSTASAVGPWQFIAPTGKRYGLTINEWVDERMDPVESTYAAADYLTTLHEMFNSWPLAIAAYNSGEGKILKGMKNFNVSNFWDMLNVPHLANETKLYVPSYLAAVIIAKDPASYDINITSTDVYEWDEVVVPAPITLEKAAMLVDADPAELKSLNPHLKKFATPPNETDFILRVPKGTKALFAKSYNKFISNERNVEEFYTASNADQESKRPPVNTKTNKNWATLAKVEPKTTSAPIVAEVSAAKPSKTPNTAIIQYKIKPKDTKNSIALMFDQSWDDISKLNKLKKNYQLKAGNTLNIAAPPEVIAKGKQLKAKRKGDWVMPSITHKVKSGDTLHSLAKHYGVDIEELKKANKLKDNTIREGQIITVKTELGRSQKVNNTSNKALEASRSVKKEKVTPAFHVVKKGDTVESISKKYNLSKSQLNQLNKLSASNSTIKIGQKLMVSSGTEGAKSIITEQRSVSKPNQASTAAKPGAKPNQVSTAAKPVAKPNQVSTAAKPVAKPNQVSTAAKPKVGSYTVNSGDTLYSIAKKNNITVEQLKKINSLQNDSVKAGQNLKLK